MTTTRVAQIVALVAAASVGCAAAAGSRRWSEEQVEEIVSLSLGQAETLGEDASNRFANDPRAAALGKTLFSDTRLSSNGKVSCATCHVAERGFQDGIPLAKGVGTTDRRTMPIAGTAHSPFLFWDGRKDSQWSQALGPLESPVEHGGNRTQYAHVVVDGHQAEYEALFGRLPDLTRAPKSAGPVPDTMARRAWEAMEAARRDEITQVYVNIGKAIAAYERTIEHAPSRFDRYAEGLARDGRAPEGVLSQDEEAGLALFVGKASCTNCHNGPQLTNNEFHNTGVPAAAGLPKDVGRLAGAEKVLADEFNCRSRWSDAEPEQCSELEFLSTGGHELERAFKVPSLRDVAGRAPYMHAGQIATLEQVVDHYDRAPRAPAGHSELEPLKLSGREKAQLVAFLRSLSEER
jgi:cytochrome c peroxidase